MFLTLGRCSGRLGTTSGALGGQQGDLGRQRLTAREGESGQNEAGRESGYGQGSKGARGRGQATWSRFSVCVRAGQWRFAGMMELIGEAHDPARESAR